jgi:hypothetical protein
MSKRVFAGADWLRAENFRGYGPSPIPGRLEFELSTLLRKWLALDEPSRLAALNDISDQYRRTLAGYSERMASLAVREHKPEHILLGLVATGLDGWRGDWRDNAMVLCLHYDAAQRIGHNAADLFEEAARVLPEKAATALRSFPGRSEDDKSLEAFGYVADADADGFRYVRAW